MSIEIFKTPPNVMESSREELFMDLIRRFPEIPENVVRAVITHTGFRKDASIVALCKEAEKYSMDVNRIRTASQTSYENTPRSLAPAGTQYHNDRPINFSQNFSPGTMTPGSMSSPGTPGSVTSLASSHGNGGYVSANNSPMTPSSYPAGGGQHHYTNQQQQVPSVSGGSHHTSTLIIDVGPPPDFPSADDLLHITQNVHPSQLPILPSNNSLLDDRRIRIQGIILSQKARKKELEEELSRSRMTQRRLEQRISALQKDCTQHKVTAQSFPNVDDIKKLHDDNHRLHMDIQLMTREIDVAQKPDETALVTSTANTNRGPTRPAPPPPVPSGHPSSRPLPMPPPNRLPVSPAGGAAAVRSQLPPPYNRSPNNHYTVAPYNPHSMPFPNQPYHYSSQDYTRPPHTPPTPTRPQEPTSLNWSCSQCTFSNHGDLNFCEMCDMPRVRSPTSH